jgi:hypothetical protein
MDILHNKSMIGIQKCYDPLFIIKLIIFFVSGILEDYYLIRMYFYFYFSVMLVQDQCYLGMEESRQQECKSPFSLLVFHFQ